MSRRKKKIYMPHWMGSVYTVFAVILVPWTIYLSYRLPHHHLEPHYDDAWVGLDIGIMIALLLTGFFASIKSRWAIISAAVVGSFLLVDAWFDVVSSRPGRELNEAIILAVFVELPLSITSFYLSYRLINKNVD